MEKFKKFVKSDKAKWIAVAVGGVVLAAAVIGLSVRVANSETTKELTASSYSVGLLDDTTGKKPTEDVDKGGLATKEYYKLDGLAIDLATDAEIKYQVNYYDEEKNFLTVQTLTVDFEAVEIPELAQTAEYVKIEIIPMEDDDDSVSWFEKFGYVKQLTVTVAK